MPDGSDAPAGELLAREVPLQVQKLLEAVRDAEERGLGFAEATEIYSGFSGIMN